MTNSALRRNVAEHLGIASANNIKTGRPVTRPEADRVNAWLDECEESWLVADDEAASIVLEAQFKREWLQELTKTCVLFARMAKAILAEPELGGA
jgi:hypothetical protein